MHIFSYIFDIVVPVRLSDIATIECFSGCAIKTINSHILNTFLALASGLKALAKLTSLYLCNCGITWMGMETIQDLIKVFSLTYL